MRVPSEQHPTRERGLMIMIGLALMTSLLLGGVAAGSFFSSRGAAWDGTISRSRSTPEIASPAPTVTSVPTPPACGGDAVTEGPVGPPVERWRFERGKTVFTAPVLVNGVLFVGSWGGYLYALDARTGVERWHHHIGRMIVREPVPGVSLVYVADAHGNIHAVDAVTGHPRWRVAVRAYPAMALAGDALIVVSGTGATTPAVAGDTIYVGGGKDDVIVQSLDAATGIERWRLRLTHSGLYALNAVSGARRWHLDTKFGVTARPVVAGDWVYVVDEAIHKVDASTGEERWQVPVARDAAMTDAIARNGMFYLVGGVYDGGGVHDGGGGIRQWIYAFDDLSGAEIWRFATGSSVSSAPAIAGNTLYVSGDDRNLYALDAATGEERWRLDLSARHEIPVIHCGVLYLGLHGGALVAIANA